MNRKQSHPPPDSDRLWFIRGKAYDLSDAEAVRKHYQILKYNSAPTPAVPSSPDLLVPPVTAAPAGASGS